MLFYPPFCTYLWHAWNHAHQLSIVQCIKTRLSSPRGSECLRSYNLLKEKTTIHQKDDYFHCVTSLINIHEWACRLAAYVICLTIIQNLRLYVQHVLSLDFLVGSRRTNKKANLHYHWRSCIKLSCCDCSLFCQSTKFCA